ncbi:MAG: hypothetical protein HQ541_22670, partial [Mariniphaga sp.]|nr:hypothetical protein [Mariniphaga sp.]
DLTVTGGNPPINYQWSNGKTTQDIDSLVAGVYAILITDSDNQRKNETIIIVQPNPDPLILSFQAYNVTQYGENNGYINLTVSGGVPPFEYIWSNGSTEKDINDLIAGVYTVTVTDAIDSLKIDSVLITQPEPGNLVTDVEGNIYKTVKIGEQTWMQENLKVTKNPNGDDIISYCYSDIPAQAETYGRLYTWNVAMDNSTLEKTQGICPDGWHLPADKEWQNLEIYLGMTQVEAEMENIWRGDNVGTKLKMGGDSGYEALLSGRRSSSGSYLLLNKYEYMWTSSEHGANAWRRCLDINSDKIGRWNTFSKSYAFSIRCIKDD